MKRSTLWLLWGVFYIICAGLGFIPEPSGMVRAMLFLLALLFFVPPAVLLLRAKKTGDSKTLGILRTVSLTSLGLTLALLVLNILFAAGSRALGNFLHGLLAVVSAPMMALGNWAVSMFLWACLFFAASQKKKKS